MPISTPPSTKKESVSKRRETEGGGWTGASPPQPQPRRQLLLQNSGHKSLLHGPYCSALDPSASGGSSHPHVRLSEFSHARPLLAPCVPCPSCQAPAGSSPAFLGRSRRCLFILPYLPGLPLGRPSLGHSPLSPLRRRRPLAHGGGLCHAGPSSRWQLVWQ